MSDEGVSRRQLRRDARVRLAAAGLPAPDVEARWIVGEAAGLSEAELAAGDEELVRVREGKSVETMVARRLAGEPLQYVLGSWVFRGIDLFVDSRVLVPRPETEITVEVALEELARHGVARGRPNVWAATRTSYAVADLGTGSGAIALALAAELPDAAVFATDVDTDALAVARANAAGAGTIAARVRLSQGSWYEALPDVLRGRFRLIVANPPYVAESEWSELPAEVRDYEPRRALVAGERGTEAIEVIAASARDWLEHGGSLVVELGATQGDAAGRILTNAGLDEIDVRADLAGRDRVAVGRKLRAE